MRTDCLSRKWRMVIFIALVVVMTTGAKFSHFQTLYNIKVSSSAAPQIGDVKLYKNIAARVARGTNYYTAAVIEHRAHNYPLKPFVTVRLPALAYAVAFIGKGILFTVLIALICATTYFWGLYFRQSIDSIVWLFLLSVAIPASCFAFFLEVTMMFHECWAAILIALMLGVHGRAPVWISVMLALSACMVRELAFPALAMMAVFAIYNKEWKEAVQWSAGAVIFILYLAYHAYCIGQIITPSDLASPGWGGLEGWSLLTKSIANTTVLLLFIPSVSAVIIILSIFGWLNLNSIKGLQVVTMISGYSVLIMVFARANNFYWILLLIPLVLTGALLGTAGVFRLLSPRNRPQLINL